MSRTHPTAAAARAVEFRLAAIDTSIEECIAGEDPRDRPGRVHIGVDGQRPRARVQSATTAALLRVATP